MEMPFSKWILPCPLKDEIPDMNCQRNCQMSPKGRSSNLSFWHCSCCFFLLQESEVANIVVQYLLDLQEQQNQAKKQESIVFTSLTERAGTSSKGKYWDPKQDFTKILLT